MRYFCRYSVGPPSVSDGWTYELSAKVSALTECRGGRDDLFIWYRSLFCAKLKIHHHSLVRNHLDYGMTGTYSTMFRLRVQKLIEINFKNLFPPCCRSPMLFRARDQDRKIDRIVKKNSLPPYSFAIFFTRETTTEKLSKKNKNNLLPLTIAVFFLSRQICIANFLTEILC